MPGNGKSEGEEFEISLDALPSEVVTKLVIFCGITGKSVEDFIREALEEKLAKDLAEIEREKNPQFLERPNQA